MIKRADKPLDGCYEYIAEKIGSSSYKIQTQNKTVIHFPVMITSDNENETRYIVDYDKFFAEENVYDELVRILGIIENCKTLTELGNSDKQKLFSILDKIEPNELEKYGVEIIDANDEHCKDVIDRDIVKLTQLKNDIINQGIVSALT